MPFQMVTLSYGRSFSRPAETRVSHTYWRSPVHTMPLSLELLQCVLAKPSMQYRSPINLESSHSSIPHSARIAHASIHLGMTIDLQESLSAEVIQRKDIGKPSVILASSKKNQSTAPVDSQSKGMPGWHGKKGKKAYLL